MLCVFCLLIFLHILCTCFISLKFYHWLLRHQILSMFAPCLSCYVNNSVQKPFQQLSIDGWKTHQHVDDRSMMHSNVIVDTIQFMNGHASLLLTTQPVLFLKRLLSTGVVKRQHLHSSTWCTVFLPWAVFSQLSIEYAFRYCSFFFWQRPLWNWLSMALYFGSISISGQLPTYPSPNPTTVYW